MSKGVLRKANRGILEENTGKVNEFPLLRQDRERGTRGAGGPSNSGGIGGERDRGACADPHRCVASDLDRENHRDRDALPGLRHRATLAAAVTAFPGSDRPTMSWLARFAGIQGDLIALGASVALLVGYQLFLSSRLRRNPTYTIQAINAQARTAWVESVMSDGKDVLAVQTLRNSTMAATFLASTAVLLILGVLTLTAQGHELGDTWHALNMLGATGSTVRLAKLMLLLFDLFVAFFSFSMSIRIYNHVGYMINVPVSRQQKVISPAHVALHLNRGASFYSTGMRAFHYMVPLVFWLFDPLLMLLSTAALLFVLFRLDRAPRVLESDYAEAVRKT